MKKYCPLIVITFLMFSCSNDKPLKLVHDELLLTEVMVDLYLATAALKSVDDNKKDSLQKLYIAQIESIHKVDMVEVEKDILTLQRVPKEYKRIHEIVEDTLAMRSKNLKNKKTNK